MSPHIISQINVDDENRSPSQDSSQKPPKGRILYCRKCEGHGEKVILKNHSPQCPYILCNCKSCEKLNYKRLKSFNKRNKEKIELAAALNAKRHVTDSSSCSVDDDEGFSRRSSFCSKTSSPGMETENNSTMTPVSAAAAVSAAPATSPISNNNNLVGLEGRSMSLGAMTVMSYDIWKAKCASEKKRLEEERAKKLGPIDSPPKQRSPSPTPIRKRAHTFVAQSSMNRQQGSEIPAIATKKFSVDEKGKGKYILLPTIPAMRIFVNEDEEEVIPSSTPSTSRPFQLPRPAPVVAPALGSPFKPVTPSSQMVPVPAAPAVIPAVPATIGNLSTEQIISSLTLHNTVLQQQQNNQLMHDFLNNLNGTAASTPTSPTADMLSILRLQQQAATLAAALQAAGITVPAVTSPLLPPALTAPAGVAGPAPATMAAQNLLSTFLQSPIYTNPV